MEIPYDREVTMWTRLFWGQNSPKTVYGLACAANEKLSGRALFNYLASEIMFTAGLLISIPTASFVQ